MANFSPVSRPGWYFTAGSERNPLEMKVAITWRRFQPGVKILARFLKLSKDFQPGKTGWKIPQKFHVVEMERQPGLKRQREHAQWGCFLGNKMAAKEKRFQWNKDDKLEICHVIATMFQPTHRWFSLGLTRNFIVSSKLIQLHKHIAHIAGS